MPPKKSPEVAPSVEGWRVGECLGGGGFATVWKATRASAPEDVRALKVLRPEHRKSLSLYKEWDALRRARHPNVVHVYEGSDDIMMMDYVEGPTVAAGLKAQKLWTLPETIAIIAEVCDGLAAVHEPRLVHHDINPNNIILGTRTVLVDFGCATQAGKHYEGPNRHPQWLSPGAVNERPANVLDDLWPIPLLALAMLTGLSPVAGDPLDVWTMLKMYDGFGDLPEDAGLPRGFDAWFTKATHPDPAARYQTAGELKDSVAKLG